LFNYELKVKSLEKENKELIELMIACDYDCRAKSLKVKEE
jgi:hypothetical protein